MSQVETKRKCYICHEYIILENESPIYSGDEKKPLICHFECFVTMKEGKAKNVLSHEEIVKQAKELQNSHKDKIENIIDKNHLYQYLMRTYDIVLLPNHIFTTLEQVFTGKYKNMNGCVEPAELLDMFERKQDFLNKTYYYNVSKGKEFKDNAGRLRYDIAIVINKVDSYRKWKETEEEKQQKIKQMSSDSKIDYSIIAKRSEQKVSQENYIIEDCEEY